MTSVPDRSRVRLPGISSRAYEHPADRSALVAMRKLTGFDVLLRRLAGLFSDRSLRLMFLASGVKASQEQFPQLYQSMLDGAYVLDLPTVPELFISQNPVGMFHPTFAKIAHFSSDQAVAEAQLRSAHLNHASSSHPAPPRPQGAAGRDSARRSPRSPP